MFQLDNGRPGERRGFVHKRILGGIKGAVSGLVGGGPGGLIRGGLSGFLAPRRPLGPAQRTDLDPRRRTVPRTTTARPSLTSAREKNEGRALKFPELAVGPNGRGCRIPGQRRDQFGDCSFFLGEFKGPNGDAAVTAPVGDAVMGRYGAALQPGSMMIDRAVCLRGMQLGNDGLCYNRGAITNKQRMWPAGRKPLLTGGEMRAINIAAAAGRKLEGATTRLQKLGMLKKPMPRRTKTKAVVVHEGHHHHSDH